MNASKLNAYIHELYFTQAQTMQQRIAAITPQHDCNESTAVPELQDLLSTTAFREWLAIKRGAYSQAAHNGELWIVQVATDFLHGTAGTGVDTSELLALTEAYCNWLIYRRAFT